jgi:thiopeptide-type bacteriocin biosynthesis protein
VVLPALHAAAAPLVADGRVAAIVVDTYRREVERYGGPEGIELFEVISAIDSDAVLAALRLTPGDEGLDRRWRLAAVGIDRLLADLGSDIAGRQALVRRWSAGLASELGDSWTRHAGTVHRKDGRALAALLDGSVDDPGVAVFAARSAAMVPVVTELRAREQAGRLTDPIDAIASSYSHMHVNRMLRGAARFQELVLYDLLDRWYRAALARAR